MKKFHYLIATQKLQTVCKNFLHLLNGFCCFFLYRCEQYQTVTCNQQWYTSCFLLCLVMVTLPTPPFAILAERNRHVRNLLRREFEKMGFLVETFALGREAGKKAVMVGDVLVLDLDSIDADLGQVVRWVYARKPSLPIVVRAHSLEEAEDCLRYGRSVFVSKDQDINHLLTTVCSMLGNSKKLKT